MFLQLRVDKKDQGFVFQEYGIRQMAALIPKLRCPHPESGSLRALEETFIKASWLALGWVVTADLLLLFWDEWTQGGNGQAGRLPGE